MLAYLLFLPLNFDFRTGVLDMKEQNKTTNIIIRVSPDEKQHIREQAELAHMNVSEFILTATQNKKIVVKDEIPQLLLAMTRIGTNINQIAHLCNFKKSVNDEQLNAVLQKQEELEKFMKKIISEISKDEEHTLDSLEKKLDKIAERIEKHGNS